MKRYPMVHGMVQVYDQYTPEDFAVWKILFERQMPLLKSVAAEAYLDGIRSIGFHADAIPDFDVVNQRLQESTGWHLVVVPGIIAEPEFFALLAEKKFPATTWLRKMHELDYLSEPDMFHDVFGHVPLLAQHHFSEFFQALGVLGVQYLDHPEVIEMLGRLYWFTVEFGLIRMDGETKIYGAGILSSHGETKFSLSDVPQHLPFGVEAIMNTPYENDRIQDKYFLITSFEQLYASIGEIQAVAARAAGVMVG